MTDLPEPMEMKLTIGDKEEMVKYVVSPGKGSTPDHVMLIPKDDAQHERLSTMELAETLKDEVALATRRENPTVAVSKPKNK